MKGLQLVITEVFGFELHKQDRERGVLLHLVVVKTIKDSNISIFYSPQLVNDYLYPTVVLKMLWPCSSTAAIRPRRLSKVCCHWSNNRRSTKIQSLPKTIMSSSVSGEGSKGQTPAAENQ